MRLSIVSICLIFVLTIYLSPAQWCHYSSSYSFDYEEYKKCQIGQSEIQGGTQLVLISLAVILIMIGVAMRQKHRKLFIVTFTLFLGAIFLAFVSSIAVPTDTNSAGLGISINSGGLLILPFSLIYIGVSLLQLFVYWNEPN